MRSFLPTVVPATVPTILASTILVPLFLLILRGIYHVYFSPLSSIPGPWYAAVSEIWILVHTLRCRKVRAIDDLFKAYGPVVRIAPTTIAFLDKDHEQQTTRLVYNALKLDKGPLYDMVHMYVCSLETMMHHTRLTFTFHIGMAIFTRMLPKVFDFACTNY